MRVWSTISLALLLLAPPGEAHAQAIRGRVVDLSTQAAVAGAQVTVTDTSGSVSRRVETDASGQFVLENVPGGPLTIDVAALGYAAASDGRVEYRGQPIFLEIGLEPAPVGAEGIVVTVTPQTPHLRSAGFYDRMKRGHGGFLTPEDIAKLKPVRPSDLVRRLHGVMVVSGREPIIRRGGIGFSSGLDCVPNLYIDGVAVRLQTRLDNLWDPQAFDNIIPPAEDIDAIEVFHGGATTPARWRSSSSACGVIVVWTKH